MAVLKGNQRVGNLPQLEELPDVLPPGLSARFGKDNPIAALMRRESGDATPGAGVMLPNGAWQPYYQEPTVTGAGTQNVAGVADKASKERNKNHVIQRDALPQGQLVATNNDGFQRLSEKDQGIIYEHNRGVYELYRQQGGVPANPTTLAPVVNDGGSGAVVTFVPQEGGIAATGSTRTSISLPKGEPITGGDVQTLDGVYENQMTAGPSVPAASGTGAPGTPESSGFGLGADETGLTAAEKATISSTTDSMLSFLLGEQGRDTPNQRGRYANAMSAMPALYLIENFAGTPINPADLEQGDENALFNQVYANALNSDSAFDYSREFLASQDAGGVDPNKALSALFQAGVTPEGNVGAGQNLIQMMAGSGQAQEQINYVKNAIMSSMVNANPMMVDVIATLLDVLGNQYLSQGGSGDGFMNWLSRNSMFSQYANGGANG